MFPWAQNTRDSKMDRVLLRRSAAVCCFHRASTGGRLQERRGPRAAPERDAAVALDEFLAGAGDGRVAALAEVVRLPTGVGAAVLGYFFAGVLLFWLVTTAVMRFFSISWGRTDMTHERPLDAPLSPGGPRGTCTSGSMTAGAICRLRDG
jgi:hypothetical protein